MEKLLPCPFCGSNASFERIGDRRQSTIISCDSCGCRLETGEEWNHGKQWNSRVGVKQMMTVDEAVERRIDEMKAVSDSALLNAIVGQACGCMGPQGDNPICHCELQSKAARKLLEDRGFKIP